MGGGTTQQSGTTTQVNQIPAWMTDAGQQNYAYAQQVAEQPLQQYQGQMVADVSPQTQQSWNVAANSGNVGADQYNASTAGYLGALSQTPMQVNAGQIANTNLQPYMDPYTQQVINATMPAMQQANALSQNQGANAANSANAFGGSRQGIQQGVAQAQGAMNIGQMIANLQNQNFAQAQAAATGDINRRLTADTTNQGAQQQKINSDIMASQGLMNTGDAMSKNNVANFNMLQSAGAGQSMQAQNQINAQMAKFAQAFNYPQQQLGTLLSSLGMTPHDTSSAGQSTQQTTTPTDWADIISKGAGAASSIYGMLPSDRRLKKDISKVGEGPGGIPAYSYRFKGASPSSPKFLGPMAQDVQKVVPDAVKQIPGSGGKLAIHTPTLDAATRGYATGTPFVSPPLTNFTPPSSPGVAKGISAMSAFKPPVRMPRGAGMPKMQKFAYGSADVQPNMDDAELGSQIMGGGGFGGGDSGGVSGGLKNISDTFGGGKGAAKTPEMKQQSQGWNAPSMGYAISGFAGGVAAVPGFGSTDTVPSLLTPGEAVLTPGAAQHVGRGRIAALNAMMPPRGGQATSMPRAGARGIAGALANTKFKPKIAGGLSA
jgi:hypothetical protein